MSKRKLVAKLKFWFGKDEPIFDLENYEVEFNTEHNYVYIYKRAKK